MDMSQDASRRPIDLFVVRYMPHARADEHEEASENVRHLVAILVQINERLFREDKNQVDSSKSQPCDTIQTPGSQPAI